MFQIDKRSIEAYGAHYYYSFRERYTGQESEVSLKDVIEYRRDLKK